MRNGATALGVLMTLALVGAATWTIARPAGYPIIPFTGIGR